MVLKSYNTAAIKQRSCDKAQARVQVERIPERSRNRFQNLLAFLRPRCHSDAMRTKCRILLPVLCISILGGIAWSALRTVEPVYQGRALSGWLEEYAAQYLIPPIGHLDQYFR